MSVGCYGYQRLGSRLCPRLKCTERLTNGQVSRQLLGHGVVTNGELHDASSTSVTDSLQHLADQLRSLTPRAAELTQKALQIGTRQKVCCCTAIPAFFK